MITKNIKYYIAVGLVSCATTAALTSCADEFDQSYAVDRPAKTAEYAYLNDYQPLKQYVDRAKNPNFKLGCGTTAADYLKKELTYALTNSNFDETVAGNAMKMASCVSDNGDMNFGTVIDYVNAATDAGLSVYGHTLAWHAQQPAKWLTSLMKDKELDVDPDALVEKEVYSIDFTTATSYTVGWGSDAAMAAMSFDGALTITTTETTSGFWDLQYMVANGISLEAGAKYVFRLELKGTPDNDNLHFVIGPWGSDIKTGVTSFNGEWQTYEVEFSASDAVSDVHMLLQSGDFVGAYSVRSVKLFKLEKPVLEVEQEFAEVDFTEATSYTVGWGSDAAMAVMSFDGALTITTTETTSGFWDLQYMVANGLNLEGGVDYVAHIELKGTPNNDNLHYVVGAWGTDVKTGVVSFNGDWSTVDIRFSSADDLNDVHILLQSGDFVGTYNVRKVTVGKMVKMNSIPMTDEEKRDTLIWAMDRWISGMMAACDGKVKAWDVVNEAISGGNPDAEGVYALQHGDNTTENGFYWQDYMGDLEYVRSAVRLARQYGPEDVKLFINDYNLESDWDQNGKLRSLIKWIERWEADGVTKIDGIGTQMHISCYMNPQTQESKKAAITNMFKLMAATGKLVRVSELDMGLVDADGKDVPTANVTEEQHHAMADLYKFVIQQYFACVPVAQQWGICQWCATDSPADSGWRGNSPVGLWTLDYYRKHTYAGFADGLAGK